MKMTTKTVAPEDVSEYKKTWAPGVVVKISSDLDLKAKDWCRKHLERHEWALDVFTSEKEHTLRFEHNHHAKLFKGHFGL